MVNMSLKYEQQLNRFDNKPQRSLFYSVLHNAEYCRVVECAPGGGGGELALEI